MATINSSKIPVPLTRRLRRFNTAFTPLIAWALLATLSIYLYSREAGHYSAQGVALPLEATLAPLSDERLVAVTAPLFSTVRAGDSLAVFDDSLIRKERTVLEKTMERLSADIEAVKVRHSWDEEELLVEWQLEFRRLERDLSQAHLEMLDRRASIETSRIEFQRLQLELHRTEQLVERGAGQVAELDDIRLRTEFVERSIEESQKAFQRAQDQLAEAERRLREYESISRLERDPELLALPLERELEVVAAQIDLLNTRLASLVLRSPLDGVVTEVLYQAGENVVAGMPVVRVMHRRPAQFVAFLPEEVEWAPQVGDRVEVRSRANSSRVVMQGSVAAVAPGQEPLPLRLRRTLVQEPSGRPVLISLPDDNGLVPGQLFTARFVR